MKLFVLLLAATVAGCGGDGSSIVDAAAVDGDECSLASGCNPISQTGCEADQKCTWQQVTETEGWIACVPDGTVALGDACTTMEPGETMGYDDCARGGYCRGVCKEICTDAPDSCELQTSECVVYAGVFDECVDVGTGLCEPI